MASRWWWTESSGTGTGTGTGTDADADAGGPRYHEPMRHVVYGTAGHIDHGKTSLVKALTGTDCDRLPEERDRGITIDLGFARYDRGDVRLHFVDVPGHERLVHTMIAGAAGIDLALLVVAADEGVMPQTREHLEVIRLMGVPGGAVALTKVDLVDADLVELAVAEVEEILAGTPFEGAPVVPVSATTGAGVGALGEVLVRQAELARPHQVDGRPYRQTVDRVFSLTGAGTVVTGTSLWGRLDGGGEVRVEPLGETARVRRLHVHGEERAGVEAGERVAVNLVGIDRSRLERGCQLLAPGPWRPTELATLHLELLPSAPGPLDEGDELELHALGARVPARVDRLAARPLAPGGAVVAQLSLRAPMMLFPGDRVVLRRPAPVNTFAGGTVLDTRLGRWPRRASAELGRLPGVGRAAWPDLLASWIERAGLAAPSTEDLAGRLGVTAVVLEGPLGRLLSDGVVVTLPTQPPRLVAAAAVAALTDRAAAELQRRLAGEAVSAGIPARDFAASLLPRRALPFAAQYLDVLVRRRVIALAEGRVVPPGAASHMTEEGAELTRRVERLYREAGFEAPSPHEAALRLEARPATVEGICRFLLQRGALARLDGKYLLHRAVLDEVARGVRQWEVDHFDVGAFKDRFGLTRKLAIPLLEWLDSQRVTVRRGNQREIRRDA